MGRWSGIKDTRAPGDGDYFSPGVYPLLRVRSTSVFQSQQKKNVEFFLLEAEVLEEPKYSEDDLEIHRYMREKDPKNGKRFHAGDTISWMVNLSHDSAQSNCKGLAQALLPGQDITEKEMVELENNAAEGMHFKAVARLVKTRAGDDFTKVIFASADEHPAEEPAKPAGRSWGR